MKRNTQHKQPQPQPTIDLLTPLELAGMLRVTPQCISNWKRSGKITAVIDAGKIVRFNLDQVLAALGGAK